MSPRAATKLGPVEDHNLIWEDNGGDVMESAGGMVIPLTSEPPRGNEIGPSGGGAEAGVHPGIIWEGENGGDRQRPHPIRE